MSAAFPACEPVAAHFASPLVYYVNSTADFPPLLDELYGAMRELNYFMGDVFGARLALEEALVNAIKHGHGYDRSKTVRVRFEVSAEEVLAEVEDEGPGFDPGEVPDPCAAENLERSCGRGLLLIRFYTTWVHFNERGNRVTFCKRRSTD